MQCPLFDSYRNTVATKLQPFHRSPENLPQIFTHPESTKTEYSVLLIHGLKGSGSQLNDLGKELHQQGLNVVSILLSGHGTRPEDLEHVHLQDWKEDLEMGIQIAAQLGQKILIAGLSGGATLAVYAAIHYPLLVRGLLLFSPAMALSNPQLKWFPWLGWVMKPFRRWADENPEQIKEDHPAQYSKLATKAVIELSKLMKQVVHPSALRKVNAPIFAVFTDSDHIVDVQESIQLLEKTSGPVTTMRLPASEKIRHADIIHRQTCPRFDHMMVDVVDFLNHHFPKKKNNREGFKKHPVAAAEKKPTVDQTSPMH